MMNSLASYPFAQYCMRNYFGGRHGAREQGHSANASNNNDDDSNDAFGGGEETFTPPVDIFDTRNSWTLHLAVPGAKKQDIGVNWDNDRSTLAITGVVYRPGNEEFQNSMLSGERKVGLFERKIRMPPVGGDDRDEVDGNRITAKLEDGVLVVVVPKAEKEWTEIKKVDVQ